MLTTIAWRNVWRNKKRTFVVIGALVVGIGGLSLAMGFMNGMMYSYVNNTIDADYSHIQVHHPEFKTDFETHFYIPEAEKMKQDLAARSEVKAASARLLVNGMITSPNSASGVQLYGVSPEDEAATIHLDSAMIEGTYFEGVNRNPVLVGKRLAEKLKIKERSKVVLTFQDMNGNITAGAFRVAGIFNTASPRLNLSAAYVRKDDLRKLLLLEDEQAAHEIAIALKEDENTRPLAEELKKDQPGLLVESWHELGPELELMLQQTRISLYTLLTIMMIALAFGIVNTMLMAVLERVKELGMLMAIGMNKSRVFFMIILETIMIAVVGGPVGLLIGYLATAYFRNDGINLSAYSESLDYYGISNIIYPEISLSSFATLAIAVVITAVVAAAYPAWKAIKLKPVEALRKI